jgi:hypothetical protein
MPDVEVFRLTWRWLYSRSIDDLPPIDASNLAKLRIFNVQNDVNIMLDLAIGRLYLLDGNARQAAEYLDPLSVKAPEQPMWSYYAAWVDLLVGNPESLAHRFSTIKEWPGKWTMACLLLDADPSLAKKLHIYEYLERKAASNGVYSSVIKARLALARATHPASIDWEAGAGSFEEDLESLRTVLGSALYMEDTEQVERLISLPLFRRLPLADQLTWRGLQSLITGRYIQGCALLEEVAVKYGYQRAALILSVQLLELNKTQQANYFLNKFAAKRVDNKIELLRGYVFEREDQVETADALFRELAKKGEPKAYYASGNLYLQRAEKARQSHLLSQMQGYYKRAAKMFDTAAKMGKQSVPSDCAALAKCTQFVSSSGLFIDTLSAVKSLKSSDRQYWLVWNAFLAGLFYDSPSEIVALYEYMQSLLEYFKQIDTPVLMLIIQAIVRACTSVENMEQAQAFIKLLKRFSNYSEDQPVRSLCHVGISAAAYAYYQNTPEQHKIEVMQYIARLSKADPANGTLVLLLAYTHLENRHQEWAIAALRNANSLEDLDRRLCLSLANLLQKQPASFEVLPQIHQGTVPEIALAYDLMRAASAFLLKMPAQGYENVLKALSQDLEKTMEVVNMGHVLPFLCIYANQEGVVSPELIEVMRKLSRISQDEKLLGIIARCMSAIGEIEYANELRKRVTVIEPHAASSLDQGFAKYLCHLAVKAYQSEKINETIQKLRDASSYLEGTEQGEELEKRANELELRLATNRLLKNIFPEISDTDEKAGRYHYLENIIALHSRIWKVLVDNQKKLTEQHISPGKSVIAYLTDMLITDEWSKVVRAHQSAVSFLHTLAILHRECALAVPRTPAQKERHWILSTALWMLLLCSEAFWADFSETRAINGSEERQALDFIDQEELFQATLDDIFSLHSSYASREFAAGNYRTARIHLHCLDLCQHGKETLFTTLEQYGINYKLTLETRKLERAASQANKRLEEWCARLVREAEKATKDAEAIKELPQGIRQNYEGGIRFLAPFIALEIPVVRVLTACLNWYNEWFYDLLVAKLDGIYELMLLAESVADQLAPVCSRERPYSPENSALSTHFLWRGMASYSRSEKFQALEEFKVALSWNPFDKGVHAWIKTCEEEVKDEYGYDEGDNEEEEYYGLEYEW